MKSISQEARDLVLRDAPTFAAAVKRQKAQNRHTQEPMPLTMTLEEFYDNPVLLYACLWYAWSQHTPVLFLPT